MTAEPGEVRMTVQIKRKDTGKVETFDVVGRCTPKEFEQLKAENERNAQHSDS